MCVCVCARAGDSRCFLFTVSPKLRVYTATGYNQHFMYLNQNQQTMPNGLVRPHSFSWRELINVPQGLCSSQISSHMTSYFYQSLNIFREAVCDLGNIADCVKVNLKKLCFLPFYLRILLRCVLSMLVISDLMVAVLAHWSNSYTQWYQCHLLLSQCNDGVVSVLQV